MPQTQTALEIALAVAVDRWVDVPAGQCQAHRAYIGEVQKDGQPTGEIGVIVVVPKKRPRAALREMAIPQTLTAGGHAVRVDVRESPLAEISLLRLDRHGHTAYSSAAHVQCQSPLVGGGAQIQPERANWVGTLGCMMVLDDGQLIGGITNAHVTGETAPVGTKMHQPDSRNSRYFATVHRVAPIQMSQQASNRLDLALLAMRGANGLHTCSPDQIQLGRLGTTVKTAAIGMQAVKSGRTTGVTRGQCVGVQGVSLIGYGAGKTARFVDLDVYESDVGEFSQPGDSGSAILQAGTHEFVSLLFAGGGGQTLACASRHVMAFANGELYRG